MSKYQLDKDSLKRLRTLYDDLQFHERASRRIDTEMDAVLMLELKRVGQIGKEIKSIDFEKGEIETGDIIAPKSTLEIAKK